MGRLSMVNDYALQKLKAAFFKLRQASVMAVDELHRDGVIQRFEFTFEAFWKAIRMILIIEGFECQGPRSCIKEGARRGFVVEGEILLDMLEDRNKMSHIYDESTANDIFERIKNTYIQVIETNIEIFINYLNKE